MTANLDLSGDYRIEGRKLFSTQKRFYLILQDRKRPTDKKPLKFIVAKCPECTFQDTGKPDQYVSSVFESGRIEYKGINYNLSVHGDQATIRQSAMNIKSTLYL